MSGLRDKQLQEYKHCLERVMRSEQIYMDPRLTLAALAQTIGSSVNHLSQAIDAGLQMCFFDYLNSHRVRHAKKLLAGVKARIARFSMSLLRSALIRTRLFTTHSRNMSAGRPLNSVALGGTSAGARRKRPCRERCIA
jgi:transcriptional regulator GlxA family with amidase domain